MRTTLTVLASIFVVVSCHKPTRTTISVGPPQGSLELTGELASRTVLESESAVGISGSCWDNGDQWLVGERNNRLLRVGPNGQIDVFPIEGVETGLDLEGLACRDGRFYISTETETSGRTSDKVLVVDLGEDRAVVVDTLVLQYPAPMKAGANQGLEGLCLAGDWLIAAGEILRTNASDVRQAPILRQKIGDSNTYLHWVNLSSRSGKVSGLDCRERGGIIEVFAMERHFEVSRILQFELGDTPSKPQTVLELAGILRETENFEAILVDERGRVRLNNDNQYRTITGPSETTFLEPVPAFAH